jgi:hypothetical protein
VKLLSPPRDVSATLEASEEEAKRLAEETGGVLIRHQGTKGHCWFLFTSGTWLLILPEAVP